MARRVAHCLVAAVVVLAACSGDAADQAGSTSPPVTAFGSLPGGVGDAVTDALAPHREIPGVVVGLRTSEGETYVQAFGFRDVGSAEPLRPDAVFSIGSIHKLFKWVLLHRLATDPEIALDLTEELGGIESDLAGAALIVASLGGG